MTKLIEILNKIKPDFSHLEKLAIQNAESQNFGEDFIEYLKDFYENIPMEIEKIKKDFLSHPKYNINGKTIVVKDIALSGSYSKGNPTPDSDVDIKIYYQGDADPEDVSIEFSGQIGGNYGSYDAHGEKIN